jgi:hypothetical protein
LLSVYLLLNVSLEVALTVEEEEMIRLREYIPQRTDDGRNIRTVPIGNSLAPWRIWLEDGDVGANKHVDRLLSLSERRDDLIKQFNLRLRAELGPKARGLVRSWRRF